MQVVQMKTMKKEPLSQTIIDNLNSAVLMFDDRLGLVYINPAGEMLFGISARQVLGTTATDLLPGNRIVIDYIEQVKQDGHPLTERELQITLPDGRAITVDCTLTPLIGTGDVNNVLVELTQVDRQLRINREENLMAQNQVTRMLVRGMAHEIKNPLGGLRGAAQLLERELPDDSLTEYTRIIIGEADRLRNLVNRMLGPNTLPKNERINIHEVLERVRSLILAEASIGVTIRRDYDPSIPLLMADRDQLIQAVLNIVRNALQAMDGAGNITLHTCVERQFMIGKTRHKLVARIDITDNGPGIDEALQESIFYPMVTGNANGTGLGLSIAQSLINQHGGLIECESRQGETTFTLLLPIDTSNGEPV